MTDMARDSREQSVVVAAGATLQQADIIRLQLESEGIEAFIVDEHISHLFWHMGFATNTHGIRIAVRQSDVPLAKEVLEAFELERVKAAEQEKAEPPEPPAPNELARKACRIAIISVLFILLWPVACYFFFKAWRAAEIVQPQFPGRFRVHQAVTLILIILTALLIWIYMWIFIGLFAGL